MMITHNFKKIYRPTIKQRLETSTQYIDRLPWAQQLLFELPQMKSPHRSSASQSHQIEEKMLQQGGNSKDNNILQSKAFNLETIINLDPLDPD